MEHDSIVVGMGENGALLYARSYCNATQREEMMSDLKRVQDTYPHWMISEMADLKLTDPNEPVI